VPHPLILAKAGIQEKTRLKITTKDTKDTKGAPVARRILPGATHVDSMRAKRALVFFVSLVVKSSERSGLHRVFPGAWPSPG